MKPINNTNSNYKFISLNYVVYIPVQTPIIKEW